MHQGTNGARKGFLKTGNVKSTKVKLAGVVSVTWFALGQGRHFNFFLGAKRFFFFNATGLLKNWK